MINLIERFLVPKTQERPAEDAIVVTSCFCAVIDGATSKLPLSITGTETPGKVAAHILSEAVKLLPPQSTAEEAVEYLTEAVAQYCRDLHCEEAVKYTPAMRPTASVALFSLYRKEVWLFGDCQCRYEGHTYTNRKLVDEILSQIRSDIVCFLLEKGRTVSELRRTDLGRKFIAGALYDQASFQNCSADNPYAYAVIDGTPFHACAIKKIPVCTGDVVLASDGYPQLCDTLEETEDILRKTNNRDPLCVKENKQTKGILPMANSYDDRSYLRFSV